MRRAALLLALLVAACGGGSDAPAAAPKVDAEAERLLSGVVLHYEDLGAPWIQEADEPAEDGCSGQAFAAEAGYRTFVAPTSYERTDVVFSSAMALARADQVPRYLDLLEGDRFVRCVATAFRDQGRPIDPDGAAMRRDVIAGAEHSLVQELPFEGGGAVMGVVARGRALASVQAISTDGPVEEALVERLLTVLAERLKG